MAEFYKLLRTEQSGPYYTVYIPENPRKMVIYIHARMDFPHAKGRKSRTLYNFQEEVAEGIFNANPDTIAVAARYFKGLFNIVFPLIQKYNVKEIIVSGWSLGGNDAITLLKELYDAKLTGMKLLLIDANHTNQFSDKVFQAIKDTKTFYISNTLSKAKTKHISKLINFGMLSQYLHLKIPRWFSGSNHRYCRDSTINNNVYGYLFGGNLNGDYAIGRWDSGKGGIVT